VEIREKTTEEPETRREEQGVELEGEEEQVGVEEPSQLHTEHQLGLDNKAEEHQQGLDKRPKNSS
jgi:hypothetical protein